MRESFRGVYVISVAARLLEMHPQTLRKYERFGLVAPSRAGYSRLYSEEDVARLRLIKHLVEERRLNLAGVELALEVLDKVFEVRYLLQATEDAKNVKTRALNNLQEILQLMGAG